MGRQVSILKRPQPPFRDAPEDRIPEITTIYGGRAASVPQSFHDFVAADSNDPNTHPHMGSFTHVAIASGLWSNTAIWNTGTVPGEDAVVNVSTYDVTYDIESDVLVKDIHVSGSGTLRWATYKDTRLWIDTIMCHGTFIMGELGNPIPHSGVAGKPRAEIVFHQAEAPGATTRLGLNTMGPVRIQGEAKADRLFSAVNLAAGQVVIPLDGLAAANWREGDIVVFLATDRAGTSSSDAQYAGPTQFYGPYFEALGVQTRTLGYRLSHDEVRTIRAVNEASMVIDQPLQYGHVVTTGTLPHGQVVTIKPAVANLSRSIRFRSADPSALQTRAHTMFMHYDDIDVRYAECLNMGRTDTNPSLAQPNGTLAYDSNGGSLITDADNVRGRYPWHIHVTGAYFGRRQVIFKGLTAWAPTAEVPQPGWAITHHGSRAAIENCVVYNARGAGIVSELGNETGQWIDNTVAWCRGDGYEVSWGTRAELWQNHNGHAGIAYENQSRNILQQGNIASSCHIGWMFMQQNVAQISRVPDKYSLRLYDPMTQGYGLLGGITTDSRHLYGVEQAQIPDFHDNLCLGCGRGFVVAHRQFTERADTTPMIARGFHCVATGTPLHLINYSFDYSFYDFLWAGPGFGTAASLGNVAWQFMFVNGKVKDFDTGFYQNGLGFNFNGFWIDILFENVGTEFTHFVADWDITAWQAAHPGGVFPDDHPFFNLMGPWVTDEDVSVDGVRWKGVLREWKSLNSATDLPQPYPAAPRGEGGVEPSPGTPKPYFVLDPSSDTTVTDSANSVNYKGILVDRVGVRCWPETFSSESFSPSSVNFGRPTRVNAAATATELVQRNGCFLDGDVWKTRNWHTEHERLTGEYFQFAVDLTINGLTTEYLTSNVVTPVAPQVPLVREELGTVRPIVVSAVPPTIVSFATLSLDEGQPLAITLKANDGHVKWTLSGADAARFEVAFVSNLPNLRWAGNGVKDYGAPDDADLNNVYQAQVTATNSFGFASSQAVSITVINKTMGVVSPFTDNFNRADGNLESSPDWFRVGGTEGRAVISGNKVRLTTATGTSRTAYLSPDTGSANHFVQAVGLDGFGSGWIAVSLTDSENFIGLRRIGGTTTATLIKRVANVDTTLGSWPGATSSGATMRLEYESGVATVKVNGSTIEAVSVSGPPPSTTRAGIVGSSASVDLIDDYAAAAL